MVLAARRGTLPALRATLASRGFRVARAPAVTIIASRLGDPPKLLGRRELTWIVTSRAVAEEVWSRNRRWHAALRTVEDIVAIGPGTQEALRRIGVGARVPTGGSTGTRGLLGELGPLAGRTVIYLRSQAAGPALATALRARGARVIDRVAYRLRFPRRGRRGPELLGAHTWVVASPSALGALRTAIGAGAYGREIRRVELLALGPRTAEAARRDGARRVRCPRESTGEAFSRFVLERLDHARA